MSSTFLIRVDGPAQIYVGPSDCNADKFPASLANFKALGVTENGLQISINTLTHRVNSDDMGGGEGNPAEMLVMGTAGTIRGVMVKYGSLALADLMTGLYGGTEGRTPIPGTPIFASGCLAFTREARYFVQGIETVAVKEGVQSGTGDECTAEQYELRNSGAIHLHPEAARKRIRE